MRQHSPCLALPTRFRNDSCWYCVLYCTPKPWYEVWLGWVASQVVYLVHDLHYCTVIGPIARWSPGRKRRPAGRCRTSQGGAAGLWPLFCAMASFTSYYTRRWLGWLMRHVLLLVTAGADRTTNYPINYAPCLANIPRRDGHNLSKSRVI